MNDSQAEKCTCGEARPDDGVHHETGGQPCWYYEGFSKNDSQIGK